MLHPRKTAVRHRSRCWTSPITAVPAGAVRRDFQPPGHPAALSGTGAPASGAGGILPGIAAPGGYLLAKERRRITMGEIVRAVRQFEGAIGSGADRSGSRVGLEIVRPLWRELQQEMLVKLDAITLEDLCQRAQTAGIRSDAHQRLDFSI